MSQVKAVFKKRAVLILCTLICIMFTACGKTKEENGSEANNPPKQEQAGEIIYLAEEIKFSGNSNMNLF